jgi:hypothetical protein
LKSGCESKETGREKDGGEEEEEEEQVRPPPAG